MLGLVRLLALGMVVGALAACQTDGLPGPEADGTAANSRVADTQKAAQRKTVSKTEARRPTVAAARTVNPAQGDTGPANTGSIRESETKQPGPAANAAPAARAPANAIVIPAQSLFGNWTLGENGGSRTCRLILGGVLIGAAYSARGEADCPHAFTSVQSWEIRGDELVLRNQARAIVGRLQPTGPSRFDGQSENGASVYLMR